MHNTVTVLYVSASWSVRSPQANTKCLMPNIVLACGPVEVLEDKKL